MALTTADIDQVALLARLSLTDVEHTQLTRELGSILEYVDQLQKVPTETVAPTTSVVTDDVLRDDVAVPCSPEVREQLLALVPRRAGEYVEVPGVFADAPSETA